MSDTKFEPRSDLLKGAIAGLAAGLVASLAMNGFQAAVSALSSSGDDGEPATQKAADRVAVVTTGAPVPDADKPAAGNMVHYTVGGLLGLAYGMAAECRPGVTAGFGTAFGTGTAALLDEAAVPAVGLGPAPWHTRPATHAYGLASHLLFGATAELTRRLLRRTLG